MASPPFQVEDQTDADFFDKLVDDDEFGVSESGPSFVSGIESDEIKAFSNLSIADVSTISEDSGGESGFITDGENQSRDVVVSSVDSPEKDILVSEESVSLVSSNSIPLDNMIESSDATTGVDLSSESTTSKDSGSRNIGIKEVQWNLFHADSAQNDGNRVGSYSDFFTELGGGEVDPFADLGDNLKVGSDPIPTSGITENVVSDSMTSVSAQHQDEKVYVASTDQAMGGTTSSLSQYQDGQVYVASTEQTMDGQNLYDSQSWENLYPGWRYDPNTCQWIQVEGYGATENTQGSFGDTHTTGNGIVSDQKSEVSYLQQTAQSVVGTVAEGCTTGSVSTWNQVQQGSTEYPAHMVFDPQYPGWYYDTIAQEWHLLESYTPAIQSTSTAYSQQLQSGIDSNGSVSSDTQYSLYGDGQVRNDRSQGVGGQNQGVNWAGSVGNYAQPNMNMWQPDTAAKSDSVSGFTANQGGNWAGSVGNYAQQNMNMWQPGTVAKSNSVSGFTENHQVDKVYGSRDHLDTLPDQQVGFKSTGNTPMYEQTSQNYGGHEAVTGFQSFVPSDSFSQHLNQPRLEKSQQTFSSPDFYGSQKSGDYSPQLFQTGTQLSYNQNEGRSSAGRPSHALVSFGFGGKLIVMKNSSSFVSNSAYGSQDSVGGSISVLDMMDVVTDKNDATHVGLGAGDYFRTLCQQSFPGPLVGGSVGTKELSKWIDERITKCESPYTDYRKGELLRLLLSLLKIASQHYGKLRSPFGTDPSLKESDRPESAVAKLFASAKRSGAQLSGYGALTHCLQNVPSEGQIRATAVEVQDLLVSGKTKEALQCAQEGQLWGPALILAAQLGDQFYVDTVKQMAHRQFVAGSPLRTLCLLIAGQPADVFAVDNSNSNGLPGAVNMSQHHAQIGPTGMLDDWEENLAIITANRTKGDELVILHLGDCLWKERGEITAAHICYLVAEANFESFSDGARLCLIGADHWKFPRTYASPEAIQRTEFYEYSMVLGNSQSVLLPFQPYKLIYAHMLAEVGKLSDSLKYCQAILKSLKTGRAPEVDAWKQLLLSLEDRIKIHQQSGFGTNLAPGKLVGKLLPLIDRSIHRMIGGAPPPPVPSGNGLDHDSHPVGPRVANSQSTMTMQSLMPSASMEPISAWAGGGNKMSISNRSISEPDFGRSPRQVDPSKEASSSDTIGKGSDSGGPTRFGRFGSSLLQKTMGWVSRSRPDRQAKLGEKNKFYYDENLKCWVEEGAAPPAEVAAPPPPPTTTFQNGTTDYNIKNAFKGDRSPANGGAEMRSPPSSERSSGIPPIPPSSNQFSARGRMGVRSRYVDTFNKGGGTTANFFSSPSAAAAKPGGGANAKFFIPTPTPTSSGEQTIDTIGESMQEVAATKEDPPTFMSRESLFSSSPPPSSSSSMQRFPSMNNITSSGSRGMGVHDNGNGNGPLSSRQRRTASWSGAINPPKVNEIKPLGEALGMSPSSFMPTNPSTMHLPMNGGSYSDDLHEVEL